MKENFIENDSSVTTKVYRFPRKVRMVVFFFLILMNMLACGTEAVFSTQIKNLKEDLDFDDKEWGLFSSIYFGGKVLGSFSFIFLLKLLNRKFLLIFANLIFSFTLFLFTITKVKILLIFCRIAFGMWQIFYIVYIPVWIDQYGIKKLKPLMISLNQIMLTFGGIGASACSTFFKWKIILLVMSIGFAIFAVVVLMISGDYYSSTIFPSSSQKDDERESIYTHLQKSDNKGNSNDFIKIALLFKRKTYIFFALGRALLFFPATANQVWIHDYLDIALGMHDAKVRFALMTPLTLTAPFLGNIVGGAIGHLSGGFESNKTAIANIVLFFFASVTGVMFPFANTELIFAIIYWVHLFFAISTIPLITGIIITSVPSEIKGSANSLTTFLTNGIGQLPAPYFYGYLNTKFKSVDVKLPMKITFAVSFVSWMFMTMGTVTKIAQEKTLKKDEEGKEEKKEESFELKEN